ncbi:MAG: twin-arginine translocation signal domain-containing protein [Planctomycetes bacterium]|nr:twin-arginine translocation signal domain-containing protein [Planctomycetota bacterium]
MSDDNDIDRRQFVRVCATAVAAVGSSPSLLANQAFHGHERTLLVDADGAPLRLSALQPGESYVFNYPYVTTPCFLIDLDRPTSTDATLSTGDGDSYRWPGGIGPRRSVVSFCGICTHKLSHPSKAVSFINYRHAPVEFVDGAQRSQERGGVIYCCSERSVYDPADGARVLGGPAPQPLAAIALEHDAEADTLVAHGTLGGEVYDRFFEKHAFRLALEYGVSDPRQPVGETSRVLPIDEYSKTRMMC